MSSLRFGTLDRYEPLCPLGRGGMAEVYLAAWEVAPLVYRPVVIKRLLPHLSGDPAVAQMFLDEARLSCRLDHPRIVRTLQAGCIGDHCCIVMEYLDGQPLHRFLKRAYEYDALPIAMAVHIAIAMLEALAYAHELRDYQGHSLDVVHRDISPHNVFVTRGGQIKVLDFGIAKARGQEGYTATGLIKGKVGYIAPEQALGAEVDRRADLFAVGVVLWEALTGMRLFKGGNEIATLNLNLHAPIPAPSSMRADVPPRLDDVLARALARDPRARFESAHQMKAELEGWAIEAGALIEDEQVARWMNELFAFELREERQRVLDAMRRHESVPPSAAPGGSVRSSVAPSSLAGPRGFWQRVTSHLSALRAGTLLSTPFENSKRGGAWFARLRLLALGVVFLCLGVVGALVHHAWREPRAQIAGSPKPSSVDKPALVERSGSTAPGDRVAAKAGLLEQEPRKAERGELSERTTPVSELHSSAANVNRREWRLSDHRQRPSSAAGGPPVRRAVPVASGAPGSTPALAPGAPDPASGNVVSTVGVVAKAESGFLTLDTVPWSRVSLAGRDLGQTPLLSVSLPAGSHVLRLRNPELGIETSYEVQIQNGKTTARRLGIGAHAGPAK